MPDWKNLVRQRLKPLQLAAAAESDLAEEVAQHLEDLFAELRSGGAGAEEAYRQAMAELDDLYPLRAGLERNQLMPKNDTVRAGESSSGNFVEGLWKDFRYALRSMRKNPVFVVFVVLTLALGIGANTTVFTLINTVVLNPLPARDPDQLAAVTAADSRNTANSGSIFPISYADLRDYQSRNEVFDSLAGYSSARGMTWLNHGASEAVFGELVTANYFATLGISPARGRFFAPEEDGAPGAHPVAILNYAAWQKRFGGAEDVVGRELDVNNVTVTVIGVAPPHFIGVTAIFGPDLWVPAAMAERMFPNSMENVLTDRGKAAFFGIGRLKPHVTQAQARANIATLATAIARAYPAATEVHNATVRPLSEVLLPGGASTSPMVFASAALLIVVGIVLLIACSNVANLLLARSAARHQEMAVRLAMGASRGRLVRQLLTESVLLGVLSGVAGLFLAYAGLEVLFGQLPGSANFPTPKLDAAVFVFTLIVSLATGFLFGAIPAFKASRANVAEGLKESARTAGRSRRRVTIANALLVGQVAFSFLLLVTAALFLRSIGRAYQMDPGFQTAQLAVFPTNPGQAGYGKPQARAYYREVRNRVQSVPGVQSVSWASNMPLWARAVTGFQVEGRQQRSRTDQIRRGGQYNRRELFRDCWSGDRGRPRVHRCRP